MSDDNVDFGSRFVEVSCDLSQDRAVRQSMESELEERYRCWVLRLRNGVGSSIVGDCAVEERIETED